MYLIKTGTMIKYLLIIVLFTSIISYAENFDRDKIYNEFISASLKKNLPNTESNKCNFALQNTVRLNFEKFTSFQKAALKPLLDRPALQTSLVTPSGKFRIHYDQTGNNAPGYDLNELADAMDSVYRFEILYLGYPMPPSDDTAGGDNLYDIYIIDMNYYGETNFEFTSSNKGPSYINIDNDFAGFYTTGINAARVTLAHEFHHAIQVGNYLFRSEDTWFYEMTSTSMEEFVFNSVNDYYNYLRNYLGKPNRSLARNNISAGDGYDISIWNIFLKINFDFGIIKRQWELIPENHALQAIAISIAEHDSMFSSILNQFGIWCFYTGVRAIPEKFFPEASNYPTLNPGINQDFVPPSKLYNISAYAASNNFLRIAYSQQNDVDTLVAIITNGDISSFNQDSMADFSYEVFSNQTAGARNIGNKFFVKFSPPKPSLWLDTEVLNNILVGTGQFLVESMDFVYPSPFKYGDNSYIYIPVESNAAGETDLNIYTVSMDLVLSVTKRIEKPFGQPVVRWNGRKINNEKLSSGVYIYVTKSGDTVKKGKLVIFDE